MLRFALLLACSCGRIGFDPSGAGGGGGDGGGGDGSVPANQIAVTVVSDGTASQAPGVPVAGATVLVDRGGTQLERHQTDATGALRLMATAPTTIHAVYDAAPFGFANTFRVYSVQAIPPGTAVVLGGRSASSTTPIQIDLPTQAGTPDYTFRLPGHCGGGDTAFASGPMLTFGIESRCSGQTAQGYGITRDLTPAWAWIDAGVITLSTSTVTVSGAYSAMPAIAVQITNVPFMAGVVALPYVTTSDGRDLIGVGELASATPPGSSTTLQVHAAPIANRLQVDIDTSSGANISMQTTQLLPITPGAATVTVDTAQLLPIFTSLSLPSATTASWTASAGMLPDVLVFDGNIAATKTISWTGYLAPAATSLDFPPLPADLAAADPTGGTWQAATVTGYGGVPATDAFAFDQSLWAGQPPDGYLRAYVNYTLF